MKNLVAYHDLYVQSNTLLLGHVFENFWNMCLEIYELYPAHVVLALALAWQAGIKNKEKLDLLTDIVINGRKRYHWWNVSCHSSIFKS